MDYRQTLEYLFTRLPMFSRIGAAAYKADLTNTIRLCDSLGNPQNKFKSIHIAGTNGKGSSSHMLAAILQSSGYKTGLYTSPHLKDFRERIKINGEMISEEFVIDFTEKIKPLVNEIEPSFFEITVAMAFEYFAEQEVDIAVIETGLGGRLDSTNIITPELSIITNIGWDHMNLLGDSLEQIAFEKAGIIKKGVPVVIGEVIPETQSIFEQTANKIGAPLSIASKERNVHKYEWINHELYVEIIENNPFKPTRYQLDLPGIYQAKNLLTVLESCTRLQLLGWKINEQTIKQGLMQVKKTTGLHGRWEILKKSPLLIIDVAHNAEGMEQLALQIKLTEHQHLHIILGMVNDKDVLKSIALLPANATYYFTKAEIPRAMPEDVLANKASTLGLKGKIFSNVNFALFSAAQKAGKKDMILVCGSVFLIGEISKASIEAIWGKDNYSLFDYIGSIDFFS